MAASSTAAMPPRQTPVVIRVYDDDILGAADALLALLRPRPAESPPDKERPAGGQPAGQEGGA